MDPRHLKLQRLVLLIHQIGELHYPVQYAKNYGWQTRVAEHLKLDQSLLSKLVRGERPGVTLETIERAAGEAGVSMDFFLKDPQVKKPDHRNYLVKVTVPRAVSAKRAEPLYPDVWEKWLASTERELTADEYDALCRLPFPAKPEPWQYEAILSTMRNAVAGRDAERPAPSAVRKLSGRPPG